MADTTTTTSLRPAPWGLFLAASVLALAGLVLCCMILMQQVNPATSPAGGFMCGPSGQGCLQVYNSLEGKLFGLPSGTWGLAYFLAR